MITTLALYQAYFKWFADNHVLLQSFQMGGVEQILGRDRADMVYPCLWLEYPSINTDTANGRILFEGAFVVMTSIEPMDIDEIPTLSAMEGIVMDILGKINDDWENRRSGIDPASITIDVILAVFSGNNHGWRVEFRSNAPYGFCYNASRFGL